MDGAQHKSEAKFESKPDAKPETKPESKPEPKAEAQHLQRGREGEDAALLWLSERGFRVVERNVRFQVGEIDIVAWERDVLCFVEVRSRDKKASYNPEATVQAPKQSKLVRSAQLYLQSRMRGRPLPRCRFDVVSVKGYGAGMQITHFRNAFEAERAPRIARGSPWQGY